MKEGKEKIKEANMKTKEKHKMESKTEKQGKKGKGRSEGSKLSANTF